MKKIVILIFLLCAEPLFAATTYDTVSNNGGCSGCTSASWSHTMSTSANGLVMAGCAFGATSTTLSSVTFGGQSMTQVAGSPFTGSGGGMGLGVYYLKAPPTGSQTVSFSASPATNLACIAISLTGVDQITTFGTSGNEQASDGSSSIALTSTTNDMCVEFLMNGFQTVTLTGGQTARENLSAGGEIRHLVNTHSGANPTMSSTFTDDFHNAFAVPVLQATAATTGPIILNQRRRR